MNYTIVKSQVNSSKGRSDYAASSQVTSRWRQNQIIEKIADVYTLTRVTILALLTSLQNLLVEYMAMGCSNDFGFASFFYSIRKSIRRGFIAPNDSYQPNRNFNRIPAREDSQRPEAVIPCRKKSKSMMRKFQSIKEKLISFFSGEYMLHSMNNYKKNNLTPEQYANLAPGEIDNMNRVVGKFQPLSEFHSNRFFENNFILFNVTRRIPQYYFVLPS